MIKRRQDPLILSCPPLHKLTSFSPQPPHSTVHEPLGLLTRRRGREGGSLWKEEGGYGKSLCTHTHINFAYPLTLKKNLKGVHIQLRLRMSFVGDGCTVLAASPFNKRHLSLPTPLLKLPDGAPLDPCAAPHVVLKPRVSVLVQPPGAS